MTIAVLTSMGWRVDGKGRSAKEAYRKAKKAYQEYVKSYGNNRFIGNLTEFYCKYDKDGTYSIYAPTFSIVA